MNLDIVLNGIAIALALAALWIFVKAQRITFEDSPDSGALSAGGGLSDAMRAQIASAIDAHIAEALNNLEKERAARISAANLDLRRAYLSSMQNYALRSMQPIVALRTTDAEIGRPDLQLESRIDELPSETASTVLTSLLSRLVSPQSNPARSPENPQLSPWSAEPDPTRH